VAVAWELDYRRASLGGSSEAWRTRSCTLGGRSVTDNCPVPASTGGRPSAGVSFLVPARYYANAADRIGHSVEIPRHLVEDALDDLAPSRRIDAGGLGPTPSDLDPPMTAGLLCAWVGRGGRQRAGYLIGYAQTRATKARSRLVSDRTRPLSIHDANRR